MMIPALPVNLCSELDDLAKKAPLLLEEAVSDGNRSRPSGRDSFLSKCRKRRVKVRQLLNDSASTLKVTDLLECRSHFFEERTNTNQSEVDRKAHLAVELLQK